MVLKRQFYILIISIVCYMILVWKLDTLDGLFRWLFPDLDKVIYDRTSFARMVLDHIILVAISSGLATIFGVLCGIGVTRKAGRDFLPVVNGLASLGQTFPPVAVLALAVPAVGFGAKPTIIALFLYGLLPVIRNTISGLETISPSLIEAAKGTGMTGLQILWRLELPLASEIIMAGIRTSTIINIGTATLGATIGAGGLGAPIIAGLIVDNQPYILQGTCLVGLFAILADRIMAFFEQLLYRENTI